MGTYISQSVMNDHYGNENINMWGDASGSDTDEEITTHVNNAIAFAEAVVHSYLYGRQYSLPISGTNALVLVKEIATTLAAHRLYEKFARQDKNEEGDKLSKQMEQMLKLLVKIQRNAIRLDASVKTRQPGGPVVV